MLISQIKGHCMAKRALEVALVGDHSVFLYGPRGSGKSTLVSAFPWLTSVHVSDSCACGNTLSASKACTCDPVRLARWVRRARERARTCDIEIEVPPVPMKEWDAQNDPKADEWHVQRVERAKEFGEKNKSLKLDETAERIKELAARRLSFSIGEWERILNVSRSIANLDQSPILKGKHVAEAIQYKTLTRGLLC
jgi:magnesium chelatase family protein